MTFKHTKTFIFSLLLLFVSACIKEDDGQAPTLNLPSLVLEKAISITEDDLDKIIDIPVRLTGTNTTNVVVNFAVVDVTAIATLDYEVLTTGKLQFSPTETEKIIQIKIIGDEIKEATESLKIQLYSPINARFEQDVCTLSILDDDDPTAGFQIPTSGYSSPTEYPGKTLVWSDEFDADTLNLKNWTFEGGAGGWGNNELQYYREDNTSLQDGHLVITAKRQNFGNSQYTSSRIITKGKQQWKYGRIDIRAALPKGQGLWPALWMLGSNIDAVSWPACGEIDIMELTGNLPNRAVGTVHYGANTAEHQYKSGAYFLDASKTFQEEFHVFSINWQNNIIEFMVDDEVYKTITPADLNGAAYPFNKHFFLIFNVAVGGNFPGNPDATTAMPQRMIVDYVRVFQ